MYSLPNAAQPTTNPDDFLEISVETLKSADRACTFIEYQQPVRILDDYNGVERGTLLPIVKVMAPQIEVIVPPKGKFQNYRSYEYVLCARNDIVVKGDTSWHSISAVSLNGNVSVEHAGFLSRLYADNGDVDLGVKTVDDKGVETFVGSPVDELTGICGQNVRVGDVAASRFSIEATGHLLANDIGAKYAHTPQLIAVGSATVHNVTQHVDLKIAGDLVCQKMISPRSLSVGGDLTVMKSFVSDMSGVKLGGKIYFPDYARPKAPAAKKKLSSPPV